MRTLEGNVIGKELKIGIVAARFNEFIVSKLIGGAEDALVRHGVNTDDIDTTGKFVIIPKNADSHIQNTAPGPPVSIADVTPMILPVPIVPDIAAEKASN